MVDGWFRTRRQRHLRCERMPLIRASVLPVLLLGAATLAPPAEARKCPGPPAEVLAESRSAVVTGLLATRDSSGSSYADVVGCVTRDQRGFELTNYDYDEFGNLPARLSGR